MSRSRSAADATRFTATGPYAHSKSPNFRGSTIPLTTPPTDETPQQKVARLRRTANEARLAQESGWERIIVRGRIWADRAHRVTAISLLGLTVVAGTVAAVGLGDMMLYNRRKRKAWFAEQQANYDKALTLAYKAEGEGALTPDLALILNKERAIEAYEQELKNRPGLWARTKGMLFGGLAKEESKGGALRAPARAGAEDIARVMGNLAGVSSTEPMAVDAVPPERYSAGVMAERTTDEAAERISRTKSTASTSTRALRGGMLDQLAENTAASLKLAPRRWTNWLTGSS